MYRSSVKQYINIKPRLQNSAGSAKTVFVEVVKNNNPATVASFVAGKRTAVTGKKTAGKATAAAVKNGLDVPAAGPRSEEDGQSPCTIELPMPPENEVFRTSSVAQLLSSVKSGQDENSNTGTLRRLLQAKTVETTKQNRKILKRKFVVKDLLADDDLSLDSSVAESSSDDSLGKSTPSRPRSSVNASKRARRSTVKPANSLQLVRSSTETISGPACVEPTTPEIGENSTEIVQHADVQLERPPSPTVVFYNETDQMYRIPTVEKAEQQAQESSDVPPDPMAMSQINARTLKRRELNRRAPDVDLTTGEAFFLTDHAPVFDYLIRIPGQPAHDVTELWAPPCHARIQIHARNLAKPAFLRLPENPALSPSEGQLIRIEGAHSASVVFPLELSEFNMDSSHQNIADLPYIKTVHETKKPFCKVVTATDSSEAVTRDVHLLLNIPGDKTRRSVYTELPNAGCIIMIESANLPRPAFVQLVRICGYRRHNKSLIELRGVDRASIVVADREDMELMDSASREDHIAELKMLSNVKLKLVSKKLLGWEGYIDRISADDGPDAFCCAHCKVNFTSFELFLVHLSHNDGKCRPSIRWNFSCALCDDKFELEESLRSHLASKHFSPGSAPSSLLRCKVCQEIVNSSNIRTHLKSHGVENSISRHCAFCDHESTDECELRRHFLKHSLALPWCCPDVDCEVGFNNHGHLLRHIQASQTFKAFSCKYCNIQFKTRGSLRQHEMYVHESRSRQCRICRRVFRNRSMYRNHLYKHKAGKACDNCGNCYLLPRMVTEHKRKVIQGLEQCERGQGFEVLSSGQPKSSSERKAKEKVRPDGKRILKCPCGSVFSSVETMASHWRDRHAGEPFCELCGTFFADKSSLIRHNKNVHDKSFCRFCKVRFNHVNEFEKHWKSVHKSTIHRCNECGFVATSKKKLSRHRVLEHGAVSTKRQSAAMVVDDLIESQERTEIYWCEKCEQIFLDETSLQVHFLQHTLSNTSGEMDRVSESVTYDPMEPFVKDEAMVGTPGLGKIVSGCTIDGPSDDPVPPVMVSTSDDLERTAATAVDAVDDPSNNTSDNPAPSTPDNVEALIASAGITAPITDDHSGYVKPWIESKAGSVGDSKCRHITEIRRTFIRIESEQKHFIEVSPDLTKSISADGEVCIPSLTQCLQLDDGTLLQISEESYADLMQAEEVRCEEKDSNTIIVTAVYTKELPKPKPVAKKQKYSAYKEDVKVIYPAKACPICGRGFSGQPAVFAHIFMAHPFPKGSESQAFSCGECGKRFVSNEYLQEHHRYFHQTLRCDKCPLLFVDAEAKDEHTCHIETELLRCSVCKDERVSYAAVADLLEHMENKHPECEHICDVCGGSFKTDHNMRLHKRQVHAVARFECTRCPYNGYRAANFRAHLHLHTNEQLWPFQCLWCYRKFATKCSLNGHIKHAHNEKRPLGCDICKQRFSNADKLEEHVLEKHEGDTTVVCVRCELMVKNELALNEHWEECEVPLQKCSVCGHGFLQKDDDLFRVHVESHRPLPKSMTAKIDELMEKNKDSLELSSQILGESLNRSRMSTSASEAQVAVGTGISPIVQAVASPTVLYGHSPIVQSGPSPILQFGASLKASPIVQPGASISTQDTIVVDQRSQRESVRLIQLSSENIELLSSMGVIKPLD